MNHDFPRRPKTALFVLLAVLFGATALALPYVLRTVYVQADPASPGETQTPAIPSVPHLSTPEFVRGVYMSQCAVGTPSLRNEIVKLIDTTELNAVVIDIKDYTGWVAFPSSDPALRDAISKDCGASDMAAFVKALHDKNIYVIGRITVFQDPRYAKLHPEESVQSKSRPGEPWKDYKGLSFVSVSSHPFWDYIVALSKASYAVGFDELNYDYIRWPSDGPMDDVAYPSTNRAEEVEKFFKYLSDSVRSTGTVLSADLFGYTTVLTDDLGIGQQLERAFPYFDYVMPMVYPSHYNKGFAGLANPNSDPYKVVWESMRKAAERTLASTTPIQFLGAVPVTKTVLIPASTDPLTGVEQATTTREVPTGQYVKAIYDKNKIRPWLQDFDYGKDYLPADISAQIQATYDAGLNSWLFWDPANRYDSLRTVLSQTPTEKPQE